MQLRLRTKLTLVMTGLVLLMVAVLSGVFLAQLLQQTLMETDKRASDLAHQVFVQAQHALTEAASQDLRPSSEDPEDVHDYVRRAFEINAGLQAQLEAAVSSPSVYEVSIADDDGLVLISNDESLPGKTQPRRPPLSQLVQSRFVQQLKVLRGPRKLYEFDYPFNMAGKPFGEVRVVLVLRFTAERDCSQPENFRNHRAAGLVISALLAAIVSGATLAPLRDISAQLDRISAGQYDRTHTGGSRCIRRKRRRARPGQQENHPGWATTARRARNFQHLARKHEFRDGRPGRRLAPLHARCPRRDGQPCGGKISWRLLRQNFSAAASAEIFPEGHPLRAVLHLEGDELSEVAAETELITVGRIPAHRRERAGHSGRRRAHGRAGHPARSGFA